MMDVYMALYCFLPDFDAVVYGDAYNYGYASDRPSHSVWMIPNTWLGDLPIKQEASS